MAPARWLLIKGLKQERRHWRDLPDRLAEKLGAEVTAVDLPGVGARQRERCPARVAAIAERLRPHAAGGPVGLLGLSLGAMVALAWAQRWPEEVATVVVGNTSAGDLSPAWQRLSWRAWPGLGRALTTRDVRRRERRVVDLISALTAPAERDALADHWAGITADAPFTLSTFVRQLRAGSTFRLGAPPPVPVLVLSGAGDRFVDPRCSAALAQALGAPHEVHPTAGHDLTVDAPDWLLDQVARWASRGA